jgi:hypothetical protein
MQSTITGGGHVRIQNSSIDRLGDALGTGMSHQMAVTMLARIGEQFGVGHQKGIDCSFQSYKFLQKH